MASVDLLLHPVRLRVVQALLGREMTPAQLVDALGDVPQATLYRHVGALAEGGMLRVVGERQARGAVERTYTVVQDAVSLGPEDVAGLSADAHEERFLSFVAAMATTFARAVWTAATPEGVDMAAERIGYRVAPMWLSDDEADELAAGIRELVTRAMTNDASPDRRRRLLYSVLVPEA